MALAACGLLIGTAMLQSCKDDDVLTGQPSWLGNSIYERLQDEGKYTTTLRLIDDLDLKEVLGHTGSKTLFAADDDAYANWFKSNDWGVTSYEQLTLAQKRMLLNNSMINNAYLIELMSNVSGTPPVEGKAMRRETASSIYDSVYVMKPSEMPDTKVWENFKSRGKSIPIFKDATSAPMIHFLPAFMSYNKITDEDLTILTNGQATSASEAWVNGKKVIERDITCKNGYIQKVADVIESSPNMAEIIHQDPRTKTWARLIDRFSAPYFYATGTREYNRIYNNEDSVYILRYFSLRSSDSQLSKNVNFDRLPGETNAHATLRFDPGWNQYTYNNTMDYDLHYDARGSRGVVERPGKGPTGRVSFHGFYSRCHAEQAHQREHARCIHGCSAFEVQHRAQRRQGGAGHQEGECGTVLHGLQRCSLCGEQSIHACRVLVGGLSRTGPRIDDERHLLGHRPA